MWWNDGHHNFLKIYLLSCQRIKKSEKILAAWSFLIKIFSLGTQHSKGGFSPYGKWRERKKFAPPSLPLCMESWWQWTGSLCYVVIYHPYYLPILLLPPSFLTFFITLPPSFCFSSSPPITLLLTTLYPPLIIQFQPLPLHVSSFCPPPPFPSSYQLLLFPLLLLRLLLLLPLLLLLSLITSSPFSFSSPSSLQPFPLSLQISSPPISTGKLNKAWILL
jgi:hypothetical protein